MMLNDYLNNHQVKFEDIYGTRDPHILSYGAGVEITDAYLFASAIEPFTLYDTLSKGAVYYSISDTSSEMGNIVPETMWYVNDKFAKVLIFQKQFHMPEDYTQIYFTKTLAHQWTKEKQYDQIFKRVGQLTNLQKDWDSYDGNAISEDCIARAIDILKELVELRSRFSRSLPVPFVAPLSSGGIQIEWEEKERYLELSLMPGSSEIEYFASDRTSAGDLSLEGSMKSVKNLEDLLLWFMNGEAEDLGSLDFEYFRDELMAA